MLVSVSLALGCQAAASNPSCFDYLEAKGFGSRSMASVRSGATVKNINDQHPALLNVLRKSELIDERPIEPAFTITLLTGGSWESQKVSIEIGKDGYGAIQHVGERVYFHCSQLPGFAEAAFNQSTIVIR